MKRKFTDSEKAEMVELYLNDKLSLAKVAEKFSTTASAVGYVIKKSGVSARPNAPYRFSKEESEKICKDYLSGISSNTLAKRLKCKPATILNLLERAGVPRRQGSDTSESKGITFDLNAFANFSCEKAQYFLGL